MKELSAKKSGVVRGRTYEYEDASFVSGDSPVTHDINTDMGRNAITGYLICDGAGNILVEISPDGTNYGGQFTMKKNERLSIDGLTVDSITITHSGSDSSYRINIA